MKKTILAALLLLMSPHSWAAGGLDLSLSNETANLSIMLSPYTALRPGGGTEFSIGGLINEKGDNIFHATVLARGVRQLDTGQYKLAAGMKLVGGDLNVDETVGALALGFQGTMLLTPSRYNPIDLIVEGFYAPSISSFTDAESYTELGARIQVDVIPQARVFLGYRRMIFDTNDFAELTLDRSVHLGLNIAF